MNVDPMSSTVTAGARQAMNLPPQAQPVPRVRGRTSLAAATEGGNSGVLPSLIPCHRGNTCEIEDFIALVGSCNECLRKGGHSIGAVGMCTLCPGPLPPPCG